MVASFLNQLVDNGLYPIETIIRLVFSIIEFHLHQTFLCLCFLLEDVHTIVGARFVGHIHLLRFWREVLIGRLEESVVEVHHVGEGTVVSVEILEGKVVF